MKKGISIILMLSLLIGLTACGSGKDEQSGAGSGNGSMQQADGDHSMPPVEEGDNADDVEGEGSDDTEEGNGTFTLYDELSLSAKVTFHEIYISVPPWSSDSRGRGKIYKNDHSNDYALMVAYDYDTEYTGSVEDIPDSMFDEYNLLAREYNLMYYSGFSFDMEENVTLDCGVEALRFEGTLWGMLGEEKKEYPVYGYAFAYEGTPIIVNYFFKNPDKVDEDSDYLKDIIDKMVKTIRTEP